MRSHSKLALFTLFFAGAALLVTDPAAARRTVVARAQPVVTRVAPIRPAPVVKLIIPAPPAVRVIVADPTPRRGWVWVHGHWDWRPAQHRWVWTEGHWRKKES